MIVKLHKIVCIIDLRINKRLIKEGLKQILQMNTVATIKFFDQKVQKMAELCAPPIKPLEVSLSCFDL